MEYPIIDTALKDKSAPQPKAATSIAASVQLENIARDFDGKFAVNGVSLDIAPGEIICLLGPSGCGKTTMLRLIAGVDYPTDGRILQNEQEISGPNSFIPPEKRNIGLMFQDFALFPHLTILENVAFGLNNLEKKQAREIALGALERVNLGHYAHDYPHILSGGEQQRVALARAIAPRPSVMLMDEPFSGLDIRLRDAMREETLTILRETHATCVIVTHQAEEAMRMGDRIAVMQNGKIIQIGRPQEIYNQPQNIFVASMFSDINTLDAKAEHNCFATPLGTFPAHGFEDGTRAVLGIRQRAIQIITSKTEKADIQTVRARVMHHKFLGDVALMELFVEGIDKLLLVRMLERNAPEPGSEIDIYVEPGSILAFQA